MNRETLIFASALTLVVVGIGVYYANQGRQVRFVYPFGSVEVI